MKRVMALGAEEPVVVLLGLGVAAAPACPRVVEAAALRGRSLVAAPKPLSLASEWACMRRYVSMASLLWFDKTKKEEKKKMRRTTANNKGPHRGIEKRKEIAKRLVVFV